MPVFAFADTQVVLQSTTRLVVDFSAYTGQIAYGDSIAWKFRYGPYASSTVHTSGTLSLTTANFGCAVSGPLICDIGSLTIYSNAGAAGSYSYELHDNTTGYVFYASWYWNGSSAFDWNALYLPLVFSTSTTNLATSSSLWASLALASSSVSCSTGNIFSDGFCTAISYLFVPDPAVLAAYSGLPAVYGEKFPMSWAYGFQAMFASSTASSTENMTAFGIDFSSVDPATSTRFGAFLPNMNYLSTTTILAYFGASRWAFIQLLMSGAIWLMLGVVVFLEVRHKSHKV